MSLTINTIPNNISNSGAFNVTTSLVEDGTHVNLRIRADIKVGGVPQTTVEKPKGIADFDFWEILKSLVPGLSFARNLGAVYNVSGGSPLIAYTVTFTEIWENAGTTNYGTPSTTGTLKFVPATGDGSAFTNYVMTTSASKFANLTLRNNICKFHTYNPSELWLVFFTEKTLIELFFSKDGGAWDHSNHFTASLGWGVIVLNSGQLLSGVTNNLQIQLGEEGAAKISEILTIYVDPAELQYRTVLEFDGLLGGKEYLDFEGFRTVDFTTLRSYFTTPKKARKPTSLIGLNRQILTTQIRDIYNTDYLKSLLLSETVAKMEPGYATPTPVTVITENAKMSGTDLFVNQIEIEYEN
jgi:hypothetical protein